MVGFWDWQSEDSNSHNFISLYYIFCNRLILDVKFLYFQMSSWKLHNIHICHLFSIARLRFPYIPIVWPFWVWRYEKEGLDYQPLLNQADMCMCIVKTKNANANDMRKIVPIGGKKKYIMVSLLEGQVRNILFIILAIISSVKMEQVFSLLSHILNFIHSVIRMKRVWCAYYHFLSCFINYL